MPAHSATAAYRAFSFQLATAASAGLPLWTTWYARRDSNPDLNVRSVRSFPLDDGRVKNLAGGAGFEPTMAESKSAAFPFWLSPSGWDAGHRAVPVELRPNVLHHGVTGENRTLVDRSTVCRLSRSATVTLGARGTSRTCLSGFSDRRLDRNGLPGELVEEEGREPSSLRTGCGLAGRTPLAWLMRPA